MASMSNLLETGWAKLLYQNDASDAVIANIGSGLQASATAGSLHVSLHTANVGETGSQNTNEATYTGYATSGRIAVARSAAGWAVSGDQISNVAEILFSACTAGSNVISHWAVGTTSGTGAGYVIDYGAFTDQPRVCTALNSTDTFTSYAHGFLANDPVVFYNIVGASSLPGTLVEGTIYYVRSTGLTVDAFTISSTVGGGLFTISTDGAGYVAKATPLTVTAGVQPKIPAGTLIIRRS